VADLIPGDLRVAGVWRFIREQSAHAKAIQLRRWSGDAGAFEQGWRDVRHEGACIDAAL
jgi:hypothetical protein